MGFERIVGQRLIVDSLRNAIKTGKIGHAYIFEGAEGIGKATTAMTFAKGIHCKNYNQDMCDQCVSCLKMDGNNHPDIKVIEPEGKSIKNKQIEEFQQDLLRKPYESDKKVYIIKNADVMTDSAQNRLLKTLEEPSLYAVIILISTNINNFLPTIKSRCQIVKFHPIGDNLMEEFLINRYGIEKDEAKILSAFSDGVIGKAINLKESEDFNIKREETIHTIKEILEKDPIKAFEVVEFFQKYKDDVFEILDFILFWFRDLLLLAHTDSDIFLINRDKEDILYEHMKYVSYEKIGQIIKEIEKTKNDIKANVNYQLAIEIMLLRIQEG